LRGTDRPTLPREDGAFYRSYWDLASQYVHPDQPFLLISTFNEWHEGSELEPSKQFGRGYLDETRELSDALRER